MLDTAQLPVGARVKLADDGGSNRWWSVQAVNGRYTALVRQRPFRPAGDRYYTVIDRHRGVRGPCNLGGPECTFSREDCEQMLAEFEAGDLEVSHRNNVPAEIIAARGVRSDLVRELNGEYDQARSDIAAAQRRACDRQCREAEQLRGGGGHG
jgi:hypothetical protein